jgi:hypothetical protein
MSCLKLHWPSPLSLYSPDDAYDVGTSLEDPPVILSFLKRAAQLSSQAALLERARLIRLNRCCPECGRAAVVPVPTEPLRLYRDGNSTAATADLLAFACECCGHEWNV